MNKWKDRIIPAVKQTPFDKTTASPPSTSEKIIPVDLETGIKLSGGNEALAREMIQLFMDELPKLREEMNDYFANQQWSELKMVIHKINGSARICYMPLLQQAAEQFESALSKQHDAQYPDFFKQMQQKIIEVQRYVEHFISN